MSSQQMTRRRDEHMEHVSDRPAVRPRVDVYENQDEYLVVADMPGVSTNELRIQLHAGRLTIEGEVRVREDGTPMEKEFTTSLFRRSFDVPETIDGDKVSAELNRGVLWLHLPKHESLKPRKIQVRAG